MSMELHVLFERSRMPGTSGWQAAINQLGFDLRLDPGIEPATSTGFWPMSCRGRESGVEFDVCDAADVVGSNRKARKRFPGADASGNFRWGGDMDELCCALAAAAGLAQITGGTVFDPQDDRAMTATEAAEEARAVWSEPM